MAIATLFELDATHRDNLGKGASRRLRRLDGSIPGIVYGGGEDAQPITLNPFQVKKALENKAFYSHILTIVINGKPQSVVLKDLQRHPYKATIHHMDFLRIRADQPINMAVPLEFTGEQEAPGVIAGGLLTKSMSELVVRCLPKFLPEKITLDLSKMELETVLHLSDIALPEGVTLLAFTHGHIEEHNLPVASLHKPRVVEEAPAEDADAAAAAVAPAKGGKAAAAPKGGKAAPAKAAAPAAKAAPAPKKK